MRISDWSSDVCSSDLASEISGRPRVNSPKIVSIGSGVSDTPTGGTSADSNRRGSSASTLSRLDNIEDWRSAAFRRSGRLPISPPRSGKCLASKRLGDILRLEPFRIRSEEHTSEVQSLMRNSYAVFCLKNKTHITQ